MDDDLKEGIAILLPLAISVVVFFALRDMLKTGETFGEEGYPITREESPITFYMTVIFAIGLLVAFGGMSIYLLLKLLGMT